MNNFNCIKTQRKDNLERFPNVPSSLIFMTLKPNLNPTLLLKLILTVTLNCNLSLTLKRNPKTLTVNFDGGTLEVLLILTIF